MVSEIYLNEYGGMSVHIHVSKHAKFHENIH